jgi:ABC-type multidrug transport system fused ATPase/permease subunit
MINSAWRYYLGLYRTAWPALALSVVISVLQAFLVMPIAWCVQYTFDKVLPAGDLWRLALVGGALLLANLALGALSLAARRINVGITKSVTQRLRTDLLRRLYTLSRAYHSSADQGRLHAVLSQDSERVDTLGTALVAQLLPSVAVCLGLAVVLVRLNVWLFLVLALAAPLFMVTGQVLKARILRAHEAFAEALRAFSRGVLFALRMMDLTVMQTAEPFELERQQRHVRHLRQTSMRFAWLNAAYVESQNAVVSVAGVVILVVGGVSVSSRSMTMGALMSFYVAVALLGNYLKQVWATIPLCASGSQSLEALFALLDPRDGLPYAGTGRMAFGGEVVLDHVSFKYQETPVLQDVSLTLPSRTTTAIIGPNGIGKTTVIHLLLGLYRPQAGRMLADGRPYDELDMPHFRQAIGVVPQHPLMFDGTVWDNLTYGAPLATREEVLEASRLATAHECIEAMADGYDTRVGENGILLSGGQRQRITIARALIRRPRLLILDEPTTHLDEVATARLMDNLRGLEFEPTILLISHDPSIVQHAERVYVIENGCARELEGGHPAKRHEQPQSMADSAKAN